MRPKRAILLGFYLCLVTVPSALLCRIVLTARRKPCRRVRPAATKPSPTYCKDVAPILQSHCLECHRKGQVAPFGLETYEQARKRASDISNVVTTRLCPRGRPCRTSD